MKLNTSCVDNTCLAERLLWRGHFSVVLHSPHPIFFYFLVAFSLSTSMNATSWLDQKMVRCAIFRVRSYNKYPFIRKKRRHTFVLPRGSFEVSLAVLKKKKNREHSESNYDLSLNDFLLYCHGSLFFFFSLSSSCGTHFFSSHCRLEHSNSPVLITPVASISRRGVTWDILLDRGRHLACFAGWATIPFVVSLPAGFFFFIRVSHVSTVLFASTYRWALVSRT